MRKTIFGAILIGIVAVVVGDPAPVFAQAARGLTAAPRVARVYDAIFDARFGEVPGLLKQTCAMAPPLNPGLQVPIKDSLAPPEVCQVLEVVSLLWQIQLDPTDTSRDVQFRSKVDATIAAIEAWAAREPDHSEAWFYLGGAYGARVQWRVLRGQVLAAARDGKRIKDALEHALSLDASLHDANFGVGLYHYYADIAPAAAKLLRWLLLLPSGDRVKGMQEMQQARNAGQLLRGEADYQLHLIYLWYEKQTPRALELLADLRERYPHNPHFFRLIAEVQDVYLHDLSASLDSWRMLLDAARKRRVNQPGMAETQARLGMALQLDRLFETDAAVDQLRTAVSAQPSAPVGALSQAHLQLGLALDRLGYRGEAVEEYRAALATMPPGDPMKIQNRARAGLRIVPDQTTAMAYRFSIEGWRALERGAFAEAAQSLTRSLALRPEDPVTRYRHARLQVAVGNSAGALTVLEGLLPSRSSTPPTVYAAVCLETAQLYEQRGAHARALDLYRTARGVFGVDERTRDAAQRGVARLTAAPQTPSR